LKIYKLNVFGHESNENEMNESKEQGMNAYQTSGSRDSSKRLLVLPVLPLIVAMLMGDKATQ
jgi:hypothetical protein